jgi:hypothetical protein
MGGMTENWSVTGSARCILLRCNYYVQFVEKVR